MMRCSFIDRLVCFGPFETFANLRLPPMSDFIYFTRVVYVIMNNKRKRGGGFFGVVSISE